MITDLARLFSWRVRRREFFGTLAGAGAAVAAARASGDYELEGYGGREHVRLDEFAGRMGMRAEWITPRSVLRLAGRGLVLTFTCDSQKATINGVLVYLLFPVMLKGSTGLLSLLDLRKTLEPLLAPARNRGGTPVVRVCLDPGHGGKDPGNLAGTHLEKKYTLQLAGILHSKLDAAGFRAFQTRHHDVFISPAERPRIAQRSGADLFVSLHFNSTVSGRNEVRGVEVYAFTPVGASSTNSQGVGTEYRPSTGNRDDAKNLLLAFQVQKALVNSLGVEDRGVRRARFLVLRDASAPAILVEGGYLSHPTEARRIADRRHLEQFAQATLDGILSYRRLVERS